MIASIICIILWLYFGALIVRIILSWFPLDDAGVGRTVFIAVARVTDPVLRPLRAILPPLRVGGMGLDLSPIIPIIVIQILIAQVC